MHFLLSLLLVGVGALRHSHRDGGASASNGTSRSRGVVRDLYTFGAPKPSKSQLTNPLAEDGCFQGRRIVNKDKALVWAVDLVPTLPVGGFGHTKLDPFFLFQDATSEQKKCGWSGNSIERGNLGLHGKDEYIRRSVNVPGLKDVASVALAISYEDDVEVAADFVRAAGFGLAASAVDTVEKEVSHLIQDPESLNCWLTFEGSDNPKDWMNNLNTATTRFCGLGQQVHAGFKKSTMHMVGLPEFQTKVRPILGNCRNVDVVGHSLGGSIGALFTACAHSTVKSGETGYTEYEKFFFEKLEPVRLPYL